MKKKQNTKARCDHPHLVGFDLSWDASIATHKLRVLRCQLPSARRYHHGRRGNWDLNWEKKEVKTSSCRVFLGGDGVEGDSWEWLFLVANGVFLERFVCFEGFFEKISFWGEQQGMEQVAIHSGRCSAEITGALYLSSRQIEIDVPCITCFDFVR